MHIHACTCQSRSKQRMVHCVLHARQCRHHRPPRWVCARTHPASTITGIATGQYSCATHLVCHDCTGLNKKAISFVSLLSVWRTCVCAARTHGRSGMRGCAQQYVSMFVARARTTYIQVGHGQQGQHRTSVERACGRMCARAPRPYDCRALCCRRRLHVYTRTCHMKVGVYGTKCTFALSFRWVLCWWVCIIGVKTVLFGAVTVNGM